MSHTLALASRCAKSGLQRKKGRGHMATPS